MFFGRKNPCAQLRATLIALTLEQNAQHPFTRDEMIYNAQTIADISHANPKERAQVLAALLPAEKKAPARKVRSTPRPEQLVAA